MKAIKPVFSSCLISLDRIAGPLAQLCSCWSRAENTFLLGVLHFHPHCALQMVPSVGHPSSHFPGEVTVLWAPTKQLIWVPAQLHGKEAATVCLGSSSRPAKHRDLLIVMYVLNQQSLQRILSAI